MVIAPYRSGLTPDRWLSMHLHVRGLAAAQGGGVSNLSFGELERDHFPKNFEVLNGTILVPSGELTVTNIAIENGHRNSGFSHEKLVDLSIAKC